MKPYLIVKLLQGIFACIYTYLVMKYTSFFNMEVVTAFNYSSSTAPILTESFNLFRTTTSLLFTSILIGILYLIKKIYISKKVGN